MTQKDIAKALNVSRTTVGRALKNDPTINKETKERILKYCDEVGFQRNIVGTILGIKNTRNIHVFLLDSVNTDYKNVTIAGFLKAERELEQSQIKFTFHSSPISKTDEQVKLLDEVLTNIVVDAVVIIPLDVEKVLDVLSNFNIPTLSLDKKLSDNISYIDTKYENAGSNIASIINLLNLRVLILDTDDDLIASKKYLKGFEEKIKSNFNKIHISDLGHNTESKIKRIEFDNYDIVYIPRFASEVIRSLESKHKHLHYACNGQSNEIMELIEDGPILFSTSTNFFINGYLSARAIFKLLMGSNDVIKYSQRTELITSTNVHEYREESLIKILEKINIV